jgi:hypothetical protein
MQHDLQLRAAARARFTTPAIRLRSGHRSASMMPSASAPCTTARPSGLLNKPVRCWLTTQTSRRCSRRRHMPNVGQIKRVDWLAHRWPIKERTQLYGGWTIHMGEIEGNRILQATDAAEYDKKLAKQRPVCLARFIASQRTLHPAIVLVVADTYRLGRIPPELWCGYDVTPLMDLPAVTLLSAKARVVFPAWPNALIRVVREDALSALGLTAAPDARGPKLRAVA